MSDSLQRALVSVRATGKRGAPLTVFARSHQASIGKAWSFDIKEPALTGAEQLLGILASDVLGLFLDIAAKRRLVIDEAEAAVRAELQDALRYLGVIGAAGEPRYDSFSLKAYVSSPSPADQLEAAWRETLLRAPLLNTLRRAAQVDVSLQLS